MRAIAIWGVITAIIHQLNMGMVVMVAISPRCLGVRKSGEGTQLKRGSKSKDSVVFMLIPFSEEYGYQHGDAVCKNWTEIIKKS